MDSKMKLLVIGSNSFSGSYFVYEMLEKGYEVVGVSRSTEKKTAFLPYKWSLALEKFRFEQIDLNTDLEKLKTTIKTEKFSHIINFAAQSMVGESWDYPEDWINTNVLSFTSFINMLSRLDFIDRYVHVTTPEVYGSTTGFITEQAPYNPSTPYAVSRAAADMVVNCYHKAFKLPFCATRASNVYGPGQQLYRIIPRTIYNIVTNTKLNLHGGGVSRRNFVHMKDASTASLAILKNGRNGEYYHISGNEIVSIRELVEIICNMMNVNFFDTVNVEPERLGKDDAYMLNCDKLKKELSWEAKISLENGLEETIGWVKDNLNTFQSDDINYIHKA